MSPNKLFSRLTIQKSDNPDCKHQAEYLHRISKKGNNVWHCNDCSRERVFLGKPIKRPLAGTAMKGTTGGGNWTFSTMPWKLNATTTEKVIMGELDNMPQTGSTVRITVWDERKQYVSKTLVTAQHPTNVDLLTVSHTESILPEDRPERLLPCM